MFVEKIGNVSDNNLVGGETCEEIISHGIPRYE